MCKLVILGTESAINALKKFVVYKDSLGFKVSTHKPNNKSSFQENEVVELLKEEYESGEKSLNPFFCIFVGTQKVIPSKEIPDQLISKKRFLSDSAYTRFSVPSPCFIGRFPTDDLDMLAQLADRYCNIPTPIPPLNFVLLGGTSSDYGICTILSERLKHPSETIRLNTIKDFQTNLTKIQTARIICYMGHGTINAWVLNDTDLGIGCVTFPPTTTPQHFFSLSCLTGSYDTNSFAIEAVLSGKALTFVGASAQTYEDLNKDIVYAFAEQIKAPISPCIGEYYWHSLDSFQRRKKQSLSYNFFGDPTIFILDINPLQKVHFSLPPQKHLQDVNC